MTVATAESAQNSLRDVPLTISVIETAIFGVVRAACMADLGHTVIAVDTDAAKVGSLSRGVAPIYEPGLEELMTSVLATGRLRFTTDYAQVAGADAAPGQVPRLTPSQLLAGELNAKVSGTNLLMTATFVTNAAAALDVFGSLAVTPTASGLAPATPNASQPAAAAPPQLNQSFTWHHGYGFDACTAPALSTMLSWGLRHTVRSVSTSAATRAVAARPT